MKKLAKNKEIGGKKIVLEGVIESKGILRMHPAVENCSFRFIFLLRHAAKQGKKLTLCSCFIGNQDLEFIDSIRSGMYVKMQGEKLSRFIFLNSIRDMEILNDPLP